MRVVRYVICDVFADRVLAGNAIAAFTDARSLDDETMQALARELNLSESVFVLRPTGPGAEARIRIFTPSHEIPFGTNATLVSAFVLSGPLSREVIRLETARGVIPVRLVREDGRIASAWMSQCPPTLQPFESSLDLFRALGIPPSVLPIEIYDNGCQHVFVELATAEAVAAIRPVMAELAAVQVTVSIYSQAGSGWKTRVFAPAQGVPEDPATGSAAGLLALHLARRGRIGFGEEIVIEQGTELGRPSTLYARAIGNQASVDGVEVGGRAWMAARGEFTVR